MPAKACKRGLARLAAAHKDALHAGAGQEPAQIFRRNEICGAVFFLKGKAALAIQNGSVAGQVDYVGLELAHLLLQLLKGAQIARIKGYVLTVNGPE